MTTIRWLDAELDRRLLGLIASAMEKDEYRASRPSGFQLAHRRSDSVAGWYHEKVEIVDSVTDPFGNVVETTRVNYRKLEFRLSAAWPSIELRDASRSYGDFVATLGRYAEHAFRIAPLRVDVSAWARALEAAVLEPAILSMDFVDVGIGQAASAKVLIEGQRDVRRAAKKFLGERDSRLVRATMQWQPSPSVTALCELRESGSARIHDGPRGTADMLLSCLLQALGR